MYRPMEKTNIVITIKTFYENPGPRYVRQGESSGEEFYHNVLNEKFHDAIENKVKLIVNLDQTSGYASSFLDEAFGNLVYDYGLDRVMENLIVISNEEPEWRDMLYDQTFKEWEDRRLQEKKPVKTVEHSPWYRNQEGKDIYKIWEK